MKQQPRIGKAADHTKMFLGVMEGFRYQYDLREVFRDWAELAAAEIHQLPYHADAYAHDADFERVEGDYLKIVPKYKREDFDRFAELLTITQMALGVKYQDFLGQCYMRLEINNEHAGQFFTPYEVSLLIIQTALADVESIIADNGGWFTLLEPACGSGGMVIAAAQVLEEKKIHAGEAMYFQAVDIDRLCANMTLIQTGLLGLTGVVCHGDSLRMEIRSRRFTPVAHLYPRRCNRMMESTAQDWKSPADLSQSLIQYSLPEAA